MTHADLPPASTRRWVVSRKAAVVRGVVYSLLSQSDALSRKVCPKKNLKVGATQSPVMGSRRYVPHICKVTVSFMQPKVV